MWIYGKLTFDFERMKIYNNESKGQATCLMVVSGLIMLDQCSISHPDFVFSNAHENILLQEAYEYYLVEKHVLKGEL